ncbi:MAG: DUF3187 family protein [Gemmatimonadetes bacterium]|nr:DUF3187 family protein [Gemmatimonadota bacterium]
MGLALCITLLPDASAIAQDGRRETCGASGGPLIVSNDSPLRQPFLRVPPIGGCPGARASLDFRAGASNHFLDAREGDRWSFMDAETYRADVAATVALGGGRQLMLEIPFHVRSPGVLDGVIDTWHRAFGLPRGTRPDHPENRAVYRVGRDSVDPASRHVLSEEGSASGLGDVSFILVQSLPRLSHAPVTTVSAAVKLPTGDEGDLFGSGAADAALGLGMSARVAGSLWVHGSVRLVLLGRSPLRRGVLDQAAGASQALLGLEWRVGKATALLAQSSAESTPLDVGISTLDRDAFLLALGARHALRPDLELEAVFGEDLRVYTAPDLSLALGLRWLPR